MADIRITGRMVNFTRLTFDTNDHDAIRQQLTSMMSETSYQGALVIIDTTVEQELIALIQLIISLDLQPMAVIDGLLGDQARAIQFPVLPADRPLQRIKPTKEQVVETPVKQPDQPTKTATVNTPKTLSHATSYHDEILRTGQCIVQDHGDVILNAGINSGSEVIASGNIHIYGSVRGRVIAGAGGNTTARIFCHSLEAELVSIAGTYCVADDIPQDVIKKAVQIYLNDQQELVFEALQF
ncbi:MULTISPECIES: septum site-determining protein MinC [Acinetobacter]|uniref:Probable septum site-determining protein MinC n=1 Tax=Acinetobacter bereziniae LMG 1003 = CIP 70.12 TaxID=981324 RepID=N9DHL2_ACIBZ|nr:MULTISPECIES: septum site-determining protein MinC [Acinetobacter]ENV97306.1 septum site-determining protein MinC [Acinetobacter bereziniae LMG 1003 = CIP 70.12]KKW80128.1 septum site-determining protein MinC [Acinetobacter sp. Ag2]MBI0393291.1 septum site-determining protein MinC [Acinetobacter bereziniae]MBJ8421808.1 septum site-determining protein MinC [Acinetobacter bereziniae]MBJ8442643.1 septum site-determining protein MinC [Acinetobacter bereziniae]